MNLNFDLERDQVKELLLKSDEKIWYCVPFDLSWNNTYLENSFVVVTNLRLFVIENGSLSQEHRLSECEKIECEGMVNCGVLSVYKHGGDAMRLVRFSMKHFIRFSYVARGADMIAHGKMYKVESLENEPTCPKCGSTLDDLRHCPYCEKGNSSISKVFSICRPYAVRFFIISIIMVISSAFALIAPKVQQVFIDESLVNKNGTTSDVAMFILIMLGIAIGNIILSIIKSILSTYLGSRMSMELREKMFGRIQMMSLSKVEQMKPGQLMNRLTSDTTQIRQFMEGTFANLFSQIVTMIGAVVYMLVINWKLTLLTLVFLPVVYFVNLLTFRNVMKRFSLERQKNDKLNTKLQDIISGISVVKSFGKEDREVSEFKNLNSDYTDVQINNEKMFKSFFPFMFFILELGIYIVTYAAGITVIRGAMTVGVLMQFISYAHTLFSPLQDLVMLPKTIASLMNNVERIDDILNADIEGTKNRKREFTIKQGIEFENVSFGYKSYEPVLNDINLTIKPGEMIGLVGASGTGKSTIINLLMNLYEVDSGELRIDGVNINEISPSSLHSQIGVVLQETFLFNGSILDNIRFSSPKAGMQEVINAAKLANAHDFITRTPEGYNTNVGERGYNLSGGERQRIAIARAILNNPKLLILDEATSNLDTESEFLIQKALERLEKRCTTVAIAHRLSTLKNADRLVVIDKHHIAEIGTHEELINKKGIYYGLVTAQLEMAKLSDS